MVERKVSISFLYKEIKLHKFISTEPLYLTLIFIYEPFWAFPHENINKNKLHKFHANYRTKFDR